MKPHREDVGERLADRQGQGPGAALGRGGGRWECRSVGSFFQCCSWTGAMVEPTISPAGQAWRHAWRRGGSCALRRGADLGQRGATRRNRRGVGCFGGCTAHTLTSCRQETKKCTRNAQGGGDGGGLPVLEGLPAHAGLGGEARELAHEVVAVVLCPAVADQAPPLQRNSRMCPRDPHSGAPSSAEAPGCRYPPPDEARQHGSFPSRSHATK